MTAPFIKRLIIIIPIISVAIFVVISWLPTGFWSSNQSPSQTKIAPLPTFIITPDKWVLSPTSTIDIQGIQATSLILIDENSNTILAERNSHQQRPIASLTKIMTAALVLEFTQADSIVTIPKQATEDLPLDSAIMGISAGEKYTIEELLYGLLLPSGNDAAQALAYAVAGDQQRFVDLMNAKAEQLGLENTHFSNPSGLDDQNQYSSAYDVAILSHYARSFPLFQQIVATYHKELPYSLNHKYLDLVNANAFITNYTGATGIKPGNTGEAGNCLAASASRDGKNIVGVLLDTPGRNTNMIKLFDLTYEHFGVSL